MSELLKGIVEKIIQYCKRRNINLQQMDLLLIVDDEEKIKIKDAFEAVERIAELLETKKALTLIIVFDKKEENPVVGIRLGDDGIWHLEDMNVGERK